MSSRSSKIFSAKAKVISSEDYAGFSEIDGNHPFKKRVPKGFIEYRVRTRKNGRVSYFNFDLAKEMGLVAADHPHRLNAKLEAAILKAFSIQIINEFDLLHGHKFPARDIRPNRYMATRYLQLQHPSKVGKTSGDGRSIWNGTFSGNGRTWDISSCGTGATRLSPATAKNKKLYESGDPSISYGCGYAEFGEGLANAAFSEILHRNGVPTERSLAVIEFPKNLSINVRAGLNLLRPSHMFLHLKQGNLEPLKGLVDLFLERQIGNRVWKFTRGENRYVEFLNQICDTFARSTALFEREYIFCWLDWDGDNVLADGGIIDYGSIRQFGLFHHEYRFDDDDRWSTNIKEQRHKARYTVQNFAQLVDYLVTGVKKPLRSFSRHPILARFDREFELERRRLMLQKIGFQRPDIQWMMAHHPRMVKALESEYSYIERAKSKRGRVKVGDGVSWNAIFSIRDLLRELPRKYRENGLLSAGEMMEILATAYATKKDRGLTAERKRRFAAFQKYYFKCAAKVARRRDISQTALLAEVAERSRIINRYERVTGDAMSFIGDVLLSNAKRRSPNEMIELTEVFIQQQDLRPETKSFKVAALTDLNRGERRVVNNMIKIVREYRDGL